MLTAGDGRAATAGSCSAVNISIKVLIGSPTAGSTADITAIITPGTTDKDNGSSSDPNDEEERPECHVDANKVGVQNNIPETKEGASDAVNESSQCGIVSSRKMTCILFILDNQELQPNDTGGKIFTDWISLELPTVIRVATRITMERYFVSYILLLYSSIYVFG